MVDNTDTMSENHVNQINRPLKPMLIDLAGAFASVRAEIGAVPDDALVKINVDIPYATTTGLGAADRIDEILDDLAELPRYDLEPVRSMRTYAGAALHAHLLALEPAPRESSMPGLIAEATRLRGDFMLLGEALARLGLVSAAHVAALRRGRGHRDTANALCALATLFAQKWSEIGSQMPISRATVRRAARVGTQLQIALGKRNIEARSRDARDELRLARARAYTLFHCAYDHCRRGVSFVRWTYGDVEEYVPSLYPKRKRRSPARPLSREHRSGSESVPRIEVADAA